jgi:heme/copper-type cytochrome/quinol oxidase subunit 3
LVNSNYSNGLISLFITVLLGLYFLFTQFEEYIETSFRIADRVYGRTFFIRTGFHGIHVIVGTLILIYRLIHMASSVFTFNHHFIFEASA